MISGPKGDGLGSEDSGLSLGLPMALDQVADAKGTEQAPLSPLDPPLPFVRVQVGHSNRDGVEGAVRHQQSLLPLRTLRSQGEAVAGGAGAGVGAPAKGLREALVQEPANGGGLSLSSSR